MSILEFKPEGNVILQSIPDKDTLKVSATDNTGLTEDQIKALNNIRSSNENKFASSVDVSDIIIALLRTPPIGYPKLITSDGVITIPKSGKYIIHAVGGGGGGAISVDRYYRYYGNIGNPTIVEINGARYKANGGHQGMYKDPITPNPRYNGTVGATKGEKYYDGENGAFPGGKKVGESLSSGGGGGSPFPVNPNNIKAENGMTKYSTCGGGGIGYGAGGGGGVGSAGDAGGGSSGYLITEKLYLDENTEVKISIGKGGDKTIYNRGGDTQFVSGGAGAPGAVQISWDPNQD